MAFIRARRAQISLALNGYGYVKVEVEYDQANITDDLKTEQARQIKILNAISLREQGIINQTQAANLLNYDVPFGKPPVMPVASPVSHPNLENESRQKAANQDKGSL